MKPRLRVKSVLTALLAAALIPAYSYAQAWGNPKVADIRLVLGAGTRPRFSSDGQVIIFDRRNLDGHYSLYMATPNGTIWSSLTDGRPQFPRHAGNGILHPSPGYAVFVAQEPAHFLDFLSPGGPLPLGEPGVGLFNNLWITNGTQYWKLTNIPLKQSETDGIPVYATVNPRFSPNGQVIVWTERYADGGNHNWGSWRIKAARLLIGGGFAAIVGETTIFTPAPGNYVTAMRFLNPNELLVAGNMDGQHEYGMDLYRLNHYCPANGSANGPNS